MQKHSKTKIITKHVTSLPKLSHISWQWSSLSPDRKSSHCCCCCRWWWWCGNSGISCQVSVCHSIFKPALIIGWADMLRQTKNELLLKRYFSKTFTKISQSTSIYVVQYCEVWTSPYTDLIPSGTTENVRVEKLSMCPLSKINRRRPPRRFHSNF